MSIGGRVRDMAFHVPGGAFLYRCFVLVRGWCKVRRDRARLQRNGWRVLQAVHAALNGRVPYFAAFGTLLGLVREKGFIAHDDDMDFGIFAEGARPDDVVKALLSVGMTFRGGYEYDGKIREIGLSYMGLRLDFFFFERDGGNYLCHAFYAKKNHRYSRPYALSAYKLSGFPIGGIKSMEFPKAETNFPDNEIGFLACQYGESWRTPIANFYSGKSGKSRFVELPGEGFCMVPLSRVNELGGGGE